MHLFLFGHGTGVSPLIPIIYIYHLAEAEEKQPFLFCTIVSKQNTPSSSLLSDLFKLFYMYQNN